jgi:hypothetical protein
MRGPQGEEVAAGSRLITAGDLDVLFQPLG